MESKRYCAKLLPLALMALATVGCVTHRAISADAVHFNVAVERAQNQMLLVNVLRASQRSPMYLSGISKVTGSIRTQASLDLTLPFGGDSESAFNAGPGVVYAWSPTFDVAVLDTQEFTRGFMKPVPPGLLAFYVEQGWPQALLLSLLVRQMEITNTDGSVEVLTNELEEQDPAQKVWTDFSSRLEQLLAKGALVVERREEEVGGPLPLQGGVKDMLSVLDLGYTLKPADSGFRVWKEKQYFRFCPRDPDQGNRPVCKPATEAPDADATEDLREGVAVQVSDGPEGVTEVRFLLRSPQSILYYLGEIVRIETLLGQVPRVCTGTGLQPIFLAVPERTCPRGPVEVGFRGVDYLIPEESTERDSCTSGSFDLATEVSCDGGRSMQALTLVSQVISLQKSAKDLPGTELVRVVGQ